MPAYQRDTVIVYQGWFFGLHFSESEGLQKAILLSAEDQVLMAIITPLMERVHRLLPSSRDIIFMDSITTEKQGIQVILGLAHSPAGGLPVGVIVTPVGTSTTKLALELWRTLLGDESFYGSGTHGPHAFACDAGDDALTAALREVFPNSAVVSPEFYTLQSAWHWLWDSKNNISMQCRQEFFSAIRSMVDAASLTDMEQHYFVLKHSFVSSSFPYGIHKPEAKKDWGIISWICCFRMPRGIRSLWSSWTACLNNVILGLWVAAMKFPSMGRRTQRLWVTWQPGFTRIGWVSVSAQSLASQSYSPSHCDLFQQVLHRVRHFNLLQLTDYLLVRFDSFCGQRISDVGNCCWTDITSARFLMKPGTISDCDISKIGDNCYLLVSSKEKGRNYCVQSDLGLCCCPLGLSGIPCRHLASIYHKYSLAACDYTLPLQALKAALWEVAMGKETHFIYIWGSWPLCKFHLSKHYWSLLIMCGIISWLSHWVIITWHHEWSFVTSDRHMLFVCMLGLSSFVAIVENRGWCRRWRHQTFYVDIEI